MKLIPMKPLLKPADLRAIGRFRRQCGNLPFLCLNDHVMLLLTPGQTEAALMEEAEALMHENLTTRPALLVHTFPDGLRMVRTMQDLCILATDPDASCQALYQAGLQACRSGRTLALVLLEAEDRAPAAA